MLIDQNVMNLMHDIQFGMLKELIRVMNLLDVKYYFVHGSLLGAVSDNDFIAEDDDIDIAIFREDYNRLLLHGQALIDSHNYFLQNSVNDRYPLPFAKMRKNSTAFIQPVLANVNCNKGIYIDIFPIDFENNSMSFKMKRFLLEHRISQIYPRARSKSIKSCFLNFISRLYCLSYDTALLKREILFSSSENGNLVSIFGGKVSERQMPIEWFKEQQFFKFRDIEVSCPSGYKSYLARIYGENYLSHNPAEKRVANRKVEISADILDFEKSYLDYI